MQLFFFQNCISPHQMPYIEALCDFVQVDSVYVIVPRVTYGYRANLGWPESWTQSKGKLHIMVSPSDEEVSSLMDSGCVQREDVYAFYSGITAFPEVKHWLVMSLKYDKIHRGIITEAPFAKGKKWLLWLHRLHFLLSDFRFIKYFQYVFAIGEDCADYYSSWSKHWKVIPFMYCTQCNLEADDILLPQDSQEDCLQILFVGSLETRKNVRYLLEALKEADFSYELTVVGDGDLRTELNDQAASWGIKAHFLGTLPNAQISQIMAQKDVLVLPSLHDGWGAVINEAAMVGTLTACSDQCGARMISDYVFPLDQRERLTEVIREISLQLKELRSRREERKKHAMEVVSPKAVARRMMEGLER